MTLLPAPVPLAELAPSPLFGKPSTETRTRRPRLSVVIVNYCQWRWTARLVRQVLSGHDQRELVEAIVVDNHSPRHRLMSRMRRWPGLSLRRWQANVGFARAANEGCRLGQGDWLLLLNPDVVLASGFVDGVLELSERLQREEPRAGMVGFRLYNSDGSLQWSTGAFPSLASTLGGLLLPRGARKCRPLHAGRRCRVPWVTGCCLLVRRECWRDLGGFDPNFFLYYEDVDLCRRARANGWSVWFEPALHAVHHRPLHARTVPAHLRLCTRHGLLAYSARHWPAWQAGLLAALISLEAKVRQWLARWHGDRRGQRIFAFLAEMARAVLVGEPVTDSRRLERVLRRRKPTSLPALAYAPGAPVGAARFCTPALAKVAS